MGRFSILTGAGFQPSTVGAFLLVGESPRYGADPQVTLSNGDCLRYEILDPSCNMDSHIPQVLGMNLWMIAICPGCQKLSSTRVARDAGSIVCSNNATMGFCRCQWTYHSAPCVCTLMWPVECEQRCVHKQNCNAILQGELDHSRNKSNSRRSPLNFNFPQLLGRGSA